MKRKDARTQGRSLIHHGAFAPLRLGVHFRDRLTLRPAVSARRWIASLRRLLVAGCLLAFCLASTAFGPPVLTDGSYPPLRLAPDDIARLTLPQHAPAITAKAALLFDLDSGRTLFSLHPDDLLPPASTAKLMTALLVLQQADLDAEVLVSEAAAATPGSRMGLSAGQTATVRELLLGLLLPSGNDAAVALAEHVAGSEAAFVAMMNRLAGQMGLRASRFVNVHGMDAAGQTTSAADLISVARAALKYPFFVDAVATASTQAAGLPLSNTNELLGSYPGADGIKTGTTDEAGECLVASVSRRGHRLLAVVLGSPDRYADARALLDFGRAGWRWDSTSLPDNALGWTGSADGRLYQLRAAEASDLFLPAWQWPLLQPVRRLDASVPLTGTLPVGQLQWVLGGETLAQVELKVRPGP